jgi:hypothetical protein
MDVRIAGRRTGGAVAMALVGLILAFTVFSRSASSAPPQGGAPVSITDPEDAALKAQVTTEGELQVTGDVTLTGRSLVEVDNFPATQDVNVTNTSVPVQFQGTGQFEHVPAQPHRLEAFVSLENGDDFGEMTVKVPDGKIFVGEHLTALVSVPKGQQALIAIAVVEANHQYAYAPILHFQMTANFPDTPPTDHFVASEETTLYAGVAGPAELEFGCQRMNPASTVPLGVASCDFAFTGYLVDA